jgi:hypothetical protein
LPGTSDRKHLFAEIDAANAASRPDMMGRDLGIEAAAATDVEDRPSCLRLPERERVSHTDEPGDHVGGDSVQHVPAVSESFGALAADRIGKLPGRSLSNRRITATQ